MPIRPTVLLVLAAAVTACGGESAPQPDVRAALGQRQRDSAVGASAIPGARGVSAAIGAADRLDARTRAADSVGASAP
jgi:hypothetical protein